MIHTSMGKSSDEVGPKPKLVGASLCNMDEDSVLCRDCGLCNRISPYRVYEDSLEGADSISSWYVFIPRTQDGEE